MSIGYGPIAADKMGFAHFRGRSPNTDHQYYSRQFWAAGPEVLVEARLPPNY